MQNSDIQGQGKNKIIEFITYPVPFPLANVKDVVSTTEISNNYQYKNLLKQEIFFKDHGLDRSAGLEKLNEVLLSLNHKKYTEELGMLSEHLIIFASLAIKKFNPKKILEIGTHVGLTSCILATLFPDSKVFTIDLKDNDVKFRESYNRGDTQTMDRFLKVRNTYLNMRNNIVFLQDNSLFLTRKRKFNDQFDLIWIDGAHGYPIVCADIINSVSLANSNTIIMCDDIYKNISRNDSMYRSIASWETIEALTNSGTIYCDYFLKRLGMRQKTNEKYIGYITLKRK